MKPLGKNLSGFIFVFAFLMVLPLLIAACGDDDTPATLAPTAGAIPTQAEPTAVPATDAPATLPPATLPPAEVVELTKVNLALDWFPWSNHSGLFIAQERGYFAEEGLEVEIFTPGDPSTVLQTVASGRDDFGISYQPDLLIAREKGIEAVSIMALVQHPLNSVMALKESGIAEPKDLLNKTIGGPGGFSEESLLGTMLEYQGLGMEDIELINVGFNLVPALISKQVDAIVGAYWVHESISANNLGFELNIMRMEEFGVPDFYELVIVASEEKIANDPDLVQRFVSAVTRGYQEAAADPQGAVQLLKRLRPEVELEIESPGVELLAPLWATDNGVFGWQEEDRWTTFAEWLVETGHLASAADATAAYDNQFVEAVQ